MITHLIYLFIYFDLATVAPVDSSNECSSSPCQNSGTCNNRYNDYMCHCKSGYSGKNCETGKHAYGFLCKGREGDPGTRKILVSGFTCRRFGPCGHQVEEELKTCNFCQKPVVLWILVTPNEIVGLYFRDYPLKDPPPFLPSLSLAVESS